MISQMMRVIMQQEELIKAQSEAVRELAGLLAQHIGTKEIEKLPSMKKMEELNGGCNGNGD